MNTRRTPWLGAIIGSILLLSFSASAKTVNVQISDSGDSLKFFPSSITINVGDTIQWTWACCNSVGTPNHSTTSGSCPPGVPSQCVSGTSNGETWDSGLRNTNATFSHTFTHVGTVSYFCTTHGSMFGMRATVTVVQPLPPDYSISIPNGSMGPIFPNQTASYNGTLSSQSGFTSAVSLSCGTGKPSACVPNPPSAVPDTAGTPFTVTAGSATSGTFNFVVNGVGTDAAHTMHSSQPLTLTVVDFDFSALANIAVSSNASSPPQTFSVNGFNGFTGAVTFSCGGLPAGATCGFLTNPVNLSAGAAAVNDTLTITTSHTLQGSYPITVSAKTSSIPNAPTKTRSLTLNVQADYQLSISGSPAQVFPGQGGSFNGTITPLDGYTGTITITCGPFDPSITCTPPAPTTISNAIPQNFSVTFAANANTQTTTPSDYTANISASDTNALAHSQPAMVRVVDFALNGPSITAVQGNPSAPASVSITALGNWNPVVNLDVSNLPTGAIGFAFSPDASATSAHGSELVIDSGTAAVGTSDITVSGSLTGRQKSIQVPLTISAGSGTTNLGVSVSHSITVPAKSADPAPVGGTVQFTAHVVNGGAAPANPTLLITFSEAVTVVSAPGCASSGNDVTCTLSANFPQDIVITVIAPFSRTVTATAFVSSGSADTDPADNSTPDTVQVRPRPFSRDGLPPKLP